MFRIPHTTISNNYDFRLYGPLHTQKIASPHFVNIFNLDVQKSISRLYCELISKIKLIPNRNVHHYVIGLWASGRLTSNMAAAEPTRGRSDATLYDNYSCLIVYNIILYRSCGPFRLFTIILFGRLF